MVVKKLLILYNVNHRECSRITVRINSEDVDVVLVCGGIGGCRRIVDVPRNVLGIVDLDDDVYVLKLLKNRGAYISGQWRFVEGVCIGGIDAKNPIQNLSALIEKLPRSCRNSIVLSNYPVLNTACSSIEILESRVSIGFSINMLRELLERVERVVVISCNKALEKVCIDMIDCRLANVAVVESLTKLTIDFSNEIKLIVE